jgi:hypothetical protein
MRGPSRTAGAALAALGTGAVLLLLADAEYLRVIAATVLVAGIALGAFALASREALAEDPPPEERERR